MLMYSSQHNLYQNHIRYITLVTSSINTNFNQNLLSKRITIACRGQMDKYGEAKVHYYAVMFNESITLILL
jgi:hypothetical protein